VFHTHTTLDASGGAPVRHLDTSNTGTVAAPDSWDKEVDADSCVVSSKDSCP
jgi:hypothetical protein